MTSHYRHRRLSDPTAAFPAPLEPGEIAVNTANRQIALGDADPGSPGAPKTLLAVRVFDSKAQYAVGDFVAAGGGIYRAKVAVSPGGFDVSKWSLYQDQAYIDAGDIGVTTNFQAADAAIINGYQQGDASISLQISGKVAKAGDTMSGLLTLSGAPTAPLHAATKKYVDDLFTSGAPITLPASSVHYTPTGNVASTDVQSAISELDSEKAPLNSPVLTGDPQAPTPAANDNDTSIATTAFVQSAIGAAGYAPLASPSFTGNPQAPTPAPGDNDTSVATTAFVQNAVGSAVSGFSTGDAKLTLKTVADAGWVMANDGTIGDVSSGATTRAAQDTQALFNFLWNTIPDSLCPVSGGRGVSGLNDFSAHKTIRVPLALGRALGVANGTSHVLGSYAGEETHTLTANEQANMGVSGSCSIAAGSGVTSIDQTPQQARAPVVDDGQVTTVGNITPHTGSIGGGGGSISGTAFGGNQPHNNLQPTSYWNVMIKL